MFSKRVLTLFVLTATSFAFSAQAAPCNGEQGYEYVNYKHRNPTKGGFVSYHAFVDDTDDVYIAPTATVCGSSRISDRVRIYGTAVINGATITGSAEVFGNARVSNGAEITDSARISENANISGSVRISGKANIAGNAKVYNTSQDNFAQVYDNARISGSALITQDAQVFGNARVFGNAVILGDANVAGNAIVSGYTKLRTGLMVSGSKNDPDYEGIEKAKREAEAQAIKKKAEEDRVNKINRDRSAMINNYNQILKEIVDGEYLGNASHEMLLKAPKLCVLKASYRYKTPANSFMKATDYTYQLDLYLNDDVYFQAGKHTVGGRNCVVAGLKNVRSTDLTQRSYVDNQTGREGFAMGEVCLPSSLQSVGDAQYVAELLNKMSQICKELHK